MKVLQALHSYKPYLPHFEKKYNIDIDSISFEGLKSLLINDRFYAAHILEPVLNGTGEGFYSMWDYPLFQQKWAESKGWKETDVKKILFAQIEDYKPDVFYNCSPIRFVREELTKNINEKITKICWHASPVNKHNDFGIYGTRLTNLPPDVQNSEVAGFRSDLFHPAHDPVMDEIMAKTEKKTDVFFYGQYSRSHFKVRNEMIDQLLAYKSSSAHKIDVALQIKPVYKSFFPFSRPVWVRELFGKKMVYPPLNVFNNSIAPLYGLDLYEKIASSRIVFNAAVDFSGDYKVNMRNFEALGLGAHLISDSGIYPDSFIEGKHFTSYKNFEDFINKAEYMLKERSESDLISKAGNEMIRKEYSKQKQWKRFQDIVASI